jgi:phosphate transport system protein
MTLQIDKFSKQHTLQVFDSDLSRLHCSVLSMVSLVMSQLEQSMIALEEGDMDIALTVISRDKEVNDFEISIDNEVLEMLARHCPVANDLRTVISASKIAVELEKVGDEIALFAKQVSVLFDPKTSDPNPKLLADIVKIGNLVKIMLTKLIRAFEENQSDQAYLLLQYDRECELELQEGIRHQLSFVLQDARLIGRALDIMHIMKVLERCGEHCRNIAEYMIYMIDGVDVRHRSQERV